MDGQKCRWPLGSLQVEALSGVSEWRQQRMTLWGFKVLPGVSVCIKKKKQPKDSWCFRKWHKDIWRRLQAVRRKPSWHCKHHGRRATTTLTFKLDDRKKNFHYRAPVFFTLVFVSARKQNIIVLLIRFSSFLFYSDGMWFSFLFCRFLLFSPLKV